MRRLLSLVLSAAVLAPMPLVAAAGQGATGQVAGTASNSSGQTMANTVVRLRNIGTNQLAGSTTSNAAGQFSFASLNPGNYVIEVVNSAGQVIGTSSTISLTAGAMAVTGVAVTASAGAAAAAGAAAGAGSFFGTTAGLVTLGAVGAGAAVTGVVVHNSNASPSR
jgi:hypothetical protein